MINKDAFSSFHPLVSFLYFLFVFTFTMIFTHPLCLLISFIVGLAYLKYLKGSKARRFVILFLLPIFFVATLLNPLFSHQGVTILLYLPSGNPLTLESILYGLAIGGMLVSIITWFKCYTEIMTTDKFVYLFGRIMPAMSLVLSMTLRFIPKLKEQTKLVISGQRALGRDLGKGNLVDKAKNGIKILSILITWSLENAIETADSMKSRGYGLPGRTSFSIYRFDKRDGLLLFLISLQGLYVTLGAFLKGLSWSYYPIVKGVGFSVFSVSLYLVYLALCLTPLIINLLEDRKWKTLLSTT